MMIVHSRPTIDAKDIKSVSSIVRSGQIAEGRVVSKFEKKMADYIGVRGAVAVSSGSAALHLGLIALGIKRDDEVILPTYVCLALLNAINYIGAIPKICDIELSDFNISINEVENKLSKKTKAIIVPHMFGMPALLDELLALDVPIIEDIAHSIGATYRGKKTGSFGIFSIASFYATKMLACGEGGMIFSNSKSVLDKVRDLREYDEKKDYQIRYNYKMTDIQAALGISQFQKLPSFITQRKKIAAKFNNYFSELDIELPSSNKNCQSVFYRYIIKVRQNINSAIKYLEERGVFCRRPIYKPIHRYLKLKSFPNADRAWRSALSIPIYPSLTNLKIKKIIDAVSDYFGKI